MQRYDYGLHLLETKAYLLSSTQEKVAIVSILLFNFPCVPITCVQREEEERKEEECRRTRERSRHLEKERILKERRDTEERDRKMDEKLKMIEEQRSDSSYPCSPVGFSF